MPFYALEGRTPVRPEKGRYWLAPNAQVMGEVWLGEDVGIWFGAVLRGDNEPIRIGPETNIQEHATLHTDMGYPLTTGRGCTIGHGAILHGCTLGDYVLIGMGATVLNGAVIGEGSLVGAGALVERVWALRGPDAGEPPLTRFLAEQLGTAHWFDPRPARDDLGWAPTVTVDEGLARLAASFATP